MTWKSVRKSLAAVLETADIVVRDYPSAQAFLADYRQGSVGCLVVDHQMPDMTGLELLQHLQSRGNVPPAIVITGHGNAALRERCLRAGARAMLDKPVDPDELIDMIQDIALNRR